MGNADDKSLNYFIPFKFKSAINTNDFGNSNASYNKHFSSFSTLLSGKLHFKGIQ